MNGGITINFDLGGPLLDGKKPIVVADDGYGTPDYLYSIEKILGTSQDDTVTVQGGDELFQASHYALSQGILPFGSALEIDGGAGEDTLDFTNYTGSVNISALDPANATAGDVSFKNFEIVIDTESAGQVGSGSGSGVSLLQGFWNYIAGVQTIYGNGGDDTLVVGPDGELIDGGSGDDVLVAIQASDATLDGSSGDDIILSFGGADNDLFGGAGNDTLFSLTPGTRMTGGVGADTFYFSNHTLIEDATPEDHIKAFGLDLWGGQRWEASEDPWAYGAFLFRYGMNAQGDLVIESAFGKSLGWGATFVTNADVGPETPLSGRTAGLLVFEYDMERILLVNNDTGKGLYEFFQLVFGYMYKALLGVSLFEGVDPLVLDLDGDGLELTARTPLSPVFDLDGDGFAEQTGWVRPDDGLLVFDQNANGHIDDIGELFGNPGTSLGRSRCSSRQPIHFGFGQSGQSHVGRGGALRVPCVLRRHRRRTNWLRSDSVHLASGVGCTARPRHQAWGNPRRRRSLRRGGQKVGIPTTSQYPVSPGPTRMEERGDSLATRGPSAQGRGAGLSQETRRVGVQRPKV
ncbi:MAG: calcium-binding protein [Nitrospiraceae bacterium]|nr:calcium-binding protein [Nitrospiraceae bacterium]